MIYRCIHVNSRLVKATLCSWEKWNLTQIYFLRFCLWVFLLSYKPITFFVVVKMFWLWTIIIFFQNHIKLIITWHMSALFIGIKRLADRASHPPCKIHQGVMSVSLNLQSLSDSESSSCMQFFLETFTHSDFFTSQSQRSVSDTELTSMTLSKWTPTLKKTTPTL